VIVVGQSTNTAGDQLPKAPEEEPGGRCPFGQDRIRGVDTPEAVRDHLRRPRPWKKDRNGEVLVRETVARNREHRCVEHHKVRNPLGSVEEGADSDRAAPVVNDERDLLQIQRLH
jgi:hypothetical protein